MKKRRLPTIHVPVDLADYADEIDVEDNDELLSIRDQLETARRHLSGHPPRPLDALNCIESALTATAMALA